MDVQRLAKTIQSFRTLGYHVECLALCHCSALNAFSSATKTLPYKVGLITKEVVEVCNCQVTGFRKPRFQEM